MADIQTIFGIQCWNLILKYILRKDSASIARSPPAACSQTKISSGTTHFKEGRQAAQCARGVGQSTKAPSTGSTVTVGSAAREGLPEECGHDSVDDVRECNHEFSLHRKLSSSHSEPPIITISSPVSTKSQSEGGNWQRP